MTSPSLSIIIVNWNTKSFLLNCLKSILHDTSNQKVEIIVVDNASTDGSVEAVRSRFPGVIVLENCENLGFAKANNVGIQHSTGEYLFLINSDIEALAGCFEMMCRYMDAHLSIGILGPKVLNKDFSLQRSCRKFPGLLNTLSRALAFDRVFPQTTFHQHNDTGEVDVLSGCFWMVRREALQQVGLLDENFFMYSEDKDWCRRFKNAGWTVAYYPEAQVIHYGGASSEADPARFELEMLRSNILYWKKHHNPMEVIAFTAIMSCSYLMRALGHSILYLLKPNNTGSTSKIASSYACFRFLFSRKLISLLQT